jgi:hypothetical protein
VIYWCCLRLCVITPIIQPAGQHPPPSPAVTTRLVAAYSTRNWISCELVSTHVYAYILVTDRLISYCLFNIHFPYQRYNLMTWDRKWINKYVTSQSIKIVYVTRNIGSSFWRWQLLSLCRILYEISWELVGLERGPLNLMRIIEEQFQGNSGSGLEKPKLTAVGHRCTDHATSSIR